MIASVRRPLLAALLAAFVLAAVPAVAEDEDRPASPRRPGPAVGEKPWKEITSEQVRAIRKGLAWLAGEQNPDGSWNESKNARLAVTSLSVLAFMANGNTETRGKYAKQVREGVKFILRHVTMPGSATPLIPVGYIHVKDDKYSKMHAHGYATLALALAYGMSERGRREEMKEKLELAVRLIENSQDASGGWLYHPTKKGHEGSVTVCQVQALRMAQGAGIKVHQTKVDAAISYLRRSQDSKDGGFCYSLSDRNRKTYALTAAALSTLFALGKHGEKRMITLGLDYLRDRFDEAYSGRQSWFFYGNFYAAQAMYQAAGTTWGEKYWREWWPDMRDYLVLSQQPAGYWIHPVRARFEYGNAYSTAFATLILQVPLELLPIFQR